MPRKATAPADHPVLEPQIMVGRQPIYNNRMGVFGYELLFRSRSASRKDLKPTEATAQVLAASILGFGLENFVHKRKAVINVTRAFIEVLPEVQLAPNQVVLDLPDNIVVDSKLLTRLKVLQAQGFDVSIGGLAVLKDRQLLSLANIYRIDVKTLPVNRFDNLIDYLHRYDKLALQALKIETLEQYHAYCSKGFDYLQGYFFGKPHVYTSSDLSASKLAIVQLLAKVHDLDTPIEQLEQHIIQDVSLSYKLLKLINSPFFGMAKEVDSIKRAIVLLGREEIRKMVSLLALGGMSDEPAATLEIAFLRAKICELLAERVGLPQDSYFTVGMFSALDILMKQPLNDILSQLPLSDPVKQAILQRQGMLGEALSCALAIENAQWAEIDFAKLGYADLLDVYRLAIEWTDKVMKQL